MTVATTQIGLVSTDNDHTMMGFFDGAVPAWREALPIIASALGLTVEEVGIRIGTEFAIHGTHDYPWALALAFAKDWRDTREEFVDKVENPFWTSQDVYRRKYVKAYPGVIDALTRIKDYRVPVVCVSDAPLFMAVARLIGGGVAPYIQGVYALDCPRPDLSLVPSAEWLKYGDDRIASLEAEFKTHDFQYVRKMPVHFEKPDPRGIQLAMKDFGLEDSKAVIHVGDSIPKDYGLVRTANLGDGLYVPNHAIGHLPAEYRHVITEVLKADPKRCPTAVKKVVHVVPDNHGAFGEVVNWLTRSPQVEEVPDAYRA